MVSEFWFLGGLGFKSISLHLFPISLHVARSMHGGNMGLHVREEDVGELGVQRPLPNSLIFWDNW